MLADEVRDILDILIIPDKFKKLIELAECNTRKNRFEMFDIDFLYGARGIGFKRLKEIRRYISRPSGTHDLTNCRNLDEAYKMAKMLRER